MLLWPLYSYIKTVVELTGWSGLPNPLLRMPRSFITVQLSRYASRLKVEVSGIGFLFAPLSIPQTRDEVLDVVD